MTSRFMLLAVSFLFLLSACTNDTGPVLSKRNGIPATMIMTQYEYDESVNSIMGIPSGAKVYQNKNSKPFGEPVLIASEVSLVDEPVDGEEQRVIRVNFSLKNLQGTEIAKMVVFFRPFSNKAYVVKTILNSQYESIYKWQSVPGYSPVAVVTTDLSSKQKVLETDNLSFIENSQGLFSGREYHFSQGKTIYQSVFIRHFGTGLLVEEKKQQGELSMDYHPYEFVLAGWPSGR